MLFDPVTSGLPLLDASDGDLMTKIFADNGSGWIKVGVVRDPVTRLLSAYLDFVYRGGGGNADSSWYKPALPLPSNNNSSSNSNNNGRRRRGLHHEGARDLARHGDGRERRRRQEEEEEAWKDGAAGEMEKEEKRGPDQKVGTQGEAEGEGEGKADEPEARTADQEDGGRGRGTRDLRDERDETAEGAISLDKGAEEGREEGGDADVVPTFEQLVDALKIGLSKAPVAFRPMSRLCGMKQSPFDTIVPFETLQVRRWGVRLHRAVFCFF